MQKKSPPQKTQQPEAADLPPLITFDETRYLFRKSRSGLYKLMRRDPNFPKPIKYGPGRAARSYFVKDEVLVYRQSKMDAR
ncbi:hypothetical protein D9M71_495330 [compost metagenome]